MLYHRQGFTGSWGHIVGLFLGRSTLQASSMRSLPKKVSLLWVADSIRASRLVCSKCAKTMCEMMDDDDDDGDDDDG